MKRVNAIDFTRGAVMIIMTLDHTRDFMHISSLTRNPTDLATTTPVLFFTRWITHFCAPTFVFLSGVSACLSFKTRNDPAKSRNFLLTRGLWLILLEFTLVNFALWLDLRFRVLIFEVIGAIGFGFIILALLLKLPAKWIGITGLVIVSGYELLQSVKLPGHPVLATILSSLFVRNAFAVTPAFTFIIGYPPLPWLGVLLTGFAAGRLFELDAGRRKSLLLRTGLTALALFVAIRLLNFYGDPSRWAVQKNSLFTLLSFINVSKYPPSLLFCLLMISGTLMILSFADGKNNRFTRAVSTYGKVPLFYFLVHLYILHLLMLLIMFLQGFSWRALIFGFNLGRPEGKSGLPLRVIYLIWISVVVVLYPLCRWYGAYKASHREKKWLRYL